MTNTMDKLRELGERMVARSQHCENTKDAIAMQEHAAELDDILCESEAQVDAGAVASITDEMRKRAKFIDEMSGGDDFLDMFAEELRQWADRIDQKLAARATPRTEPAEGREAVMEIIGWNNDATPLLRIHKKLHNLPAGTQLYAAPPAGDGVALDAGHGKALGEMMARIFGSGDKPLTEQESREIQALHAAQIALTSKPPAGDGARELHAHLLDMLGAKDHEDAARIIAQHHVREIQAGDGARVTDVMVREALAHCPHDLPPPARWEWIADKINAYMADPSQMDRDDAESAARVAALLAAREGGAS